MLTDHKPNHPEEKLTKKELREACKGTMVQTKIKLRSRWSAPLMYRVLMTFQLSKQDRKEVTKILVQAVTPQKAKHLTINAMRQYWSWRDISLVKDHECGILLFKGLAVCLFYKRQCEEVEPVATDPIPIGSLESEDDIWARLDLFSKSPRQLVGDVREELIELDMQVQELKHQVAIRDAMIRDLERRSKLSTQTQRRK